jgi:hypothetical protein
MDAERQRLIDEAARILGNINQYFIDVQSWNENTRVRLYPDAEPIDPDPDGQMAVWKKGLEGMLRREAELGNFPYKPEKA